MKPASRKSTPEAELRACVGRLDPKIQKLFKSVRVAVRKLFPSANEVAYDYSGHVVIAYSPTERGIDAAVAIDARAGGVRLYFNQWMRLPDPKGILQGSGKQARFTEVKAVRQLADPDLGALIRAAVDLARPLASGRSGTLIMRPTAASKRRP